MIMTSPFELTYDQGLLLGQFTGAYADAHGHVILHAAHAGSLEAAVTGGQFKLPRPQPGVYWLVLRTSGELLQFGPIEIE